MANPYADIHALSVRRTMPNAATIRPPRRWFTRLVLPALILGGFAALMVWASWDALLPRKPVTVMPVIARTGVTQAARAELFTATGWIEPRPTPIEVAALAEGVVDKLLVLPGQRVEPGAVVARLIDTDARLAVEAAEEDLAERRLRLRTAQADLAEAQAMLRGAQAALKADQDLYENKVIGVSKYEVTLAQKGVAEAKVEQARARVDEAAARIRQGEVALKMAVLRLERMTVRAAAGGVVMSLNTLPGRMVGVRSITGAMPESLVTLYDPERLQVRVEVPLDRFQLVHPDQPATVEVDVLPGRRLPGLILYDTHETDIQRNTVRVKLGLLQWCDREPCILSAAATGLPGLGIELCRHLLREQLSPQQHLRPGMIAKVRVLAPERPAGGAERERDLESLRMVIPRRLVVTAEGQAHVWIVDQSSGRALLRPIVLGSALQGDAVEALQGLQPSDKLIVSGREALAPGDAVRITGEESGP